MPAPTLIVICMVVAGLFCYFGTSLAHKVLAKIQLYDIPNHRSNHHTPTLRGGGVAITDTLLIGILLAGFFLVNELDVIWPILVAAGALALVSFVDDVKTLSVRIRLGFQLIAVILGTHVLMQEGLVFQGFLPATIDAALTAFLWLWFINLYNFMDGIDGITCSETLSISLGIIALALFATLPVSFAYYAAIVAGAAAGFLPHNWHKAKLFMGDVGSVILGFIVGWLLLRMAVAGHWYASLILPAYYLADSGITIAKRALNGEKIWQAHSNHFYQQAVKAGQSHDQVCKTILTHNFFLILVALWIALDPSLVVWGLGIAGFVVYVLIFKMRGV